MSVGDRGAEPGRAQNTRDHSGSIVRLRDDGRVPLAGGLRSQRILRVVLENRTVVHIEELLLQKVGRIRDVRVGPDGNIYVAAEGEEEGAIYRVEPAS